MSVTLTDIAAKVGVDASTVSIVLNNRPKAKKLTAQTRERILSAAKELQYQGSSVAKALASGKTSTLAFICGGIDTPHFAELASSFIAQAEARGYRIQISATQWNRQVEEDICLRMLMSRQVDGILLALDCIPPGSLLHRKIIESRFPLVQLNAARAPQNISSVRSDFVPGMRQAVAALAARGHRVIHLLAQKSIDQDVVVPKMSAFIAACQKAGIEPVITSGDVDVVSAEQAGASMASAGATAAIAYSDYAAMAMMKGMRGAGKRIPEDIDVIGIDGTLWGSLCCPALTTIVQDRERLSAEALDLLIEKIGQPDASAQYLTVPTYLKMGGSTRPEPSVA